MGKHTDALKPFDQFRAPWETEAGDEAEIDKTKLKRFIFNLLGDKAKAQDAREEAQEALTAAEAELETAKAEAASANGEEAQKKITALEGKVAKLTEERDGLVAAKEEADLRAEVIGDLDPKYAKYVVGKTQEELEASLEAVKADFGISDEPGDEDEEEEEVNPLSSRPKVATRVRNPADKDSGKGGDGIDFEAAADQILGGGRVFG